MRSIVNSESIYRNSQKCTVKIIYNACDTCTLRIDTLYVRYENDMQYVRYMYCENILTAFYCDENRVYCSLLYSFTLTFCYIVLYRTPLYCTLL
jgi:hypothetical protein